MLWPSPVLQTLDATYRWTRERVGSITSAGTMTSRPTLAPSSGTEAAMATTTASTPRRSARERVWSAVQQVHADDSALKSNQICHRIFSFFKKKLELAFIRHPLFILGV